MYEAPPTSVSVHVAQDMRVKATLDNHGSFLALIVKINDPTYSSVGFLVNSSNVQWVHDLADQLGQISDDLHRQAEEKAVQDHAMANSGVFRVLDPLTGQLESR